MIAIAALIAGLVFGLGLILSGMGNPAKVQNFLDIFGTWDPSLGGLGSRAQAADGHRHVWRWLGPGRVLPRPCRDESGHPADGGLAVCSSHAGRNGAAACHSQKPLIANTVAAAKKLRGAEAAHSLPFRRSAHKTEQCRSPAVAIEA